MVFQLENQTPLEKLNFGLIIPFNRWCVVLSTLLKLLNESKTSNNARFQKILNDFLSNIFCFFISNVYFFFQIRRRFNFWTYNAVKVFKFYFYNNKNSFINCKILKFEKIIKTFLLRFSLKCQILGTTIKNVIQNIY